MYTSSNPFLPPIQNQAGAAGANAPSKQSKIEWNTPIFYASRKVWEEMIDHCLMERPYEACGLLSGQNGRAQTIWKMINVDKSPVSFSMDVEQLRRVLLAIRDRGEHFVGIYHSHPTAPPSPSDEDIAFFHYPEAAYIIVSLANRRPTVGCFRIKNRKEVIPMNVSLF